MLRIPMTVRHARSYRRAKMVTKIQVHSRLAVRSVGGKRCSFGEVGRNATISSGGRKRKSKPNQQRRPLKLQRRDKCAGFAPLERATIDKINQRLAPEGHGASGPCITSCSRSWRHALSDVSVHHCNPCRTKADCINIVAPVQRLDSRALLS